MLVTVSAEFGLILNEYFWLYVNNNVRFGSFISDEYLIIDCIG
jgi:hypothetical protein